MKKIFCVEDDVNIRELVEYTLKRTGFDVSGFDGAESFFEALKEDVPSLILLDIMLVGMDGMDILNALKSNVRYAHIPVIMLTAKSSGLDKIKGLDNGADDYITKPFDIMELISRVNAVLRRCGGEAKSGVVYKEIELDRECRQVTVDGEPVLLTYKEFELLSLLISNPGIVFSRDKLMNDIWGTDFEGESRTVDVHIRTLRRKLGQFGEYIETVRNVGYKVG